MKKLIFLLILVSALFAQEKRALWLYDNNQAFADGDTLYSDQFSVYDSLEYGLYSTDSIDVDVYVEYSVNGASWTRSSKLDDFIKTGAGGEETGGIQIPAGFFYGRMLFLFAASANTAEGGYLQGWIKNRKSVGANY